MEREARFYLSRVFLHLNVFVASLRVCAFVFVRVCVCVRALLRAHFVIFRQRTTNVLKRIIYYYYYYYKLQEM